MLSLNYGIILGEIQEEGKRTKERMRRDYFPNTLLNLLAFRASQEEN